MTHRTLCAGDRIERLAHGAIADSVEVHLESGGVESRDGLPEESGLHHRDAADFTRQVIRLQQHRGVVFHHPVLHDLHGARIDERRAVLSSQQFETGDLLEPLGVLPPERGDHVQAERAAAFERTVGLEVILIHLRVLDGGDAIAVEEPHRVFESRDALRRGRRR